MSAPAAGRKAHVRTADLRGASRLAVDATLGLTNLVENLHHNILRTPGPLGTVTERQTGGITGLVYRSIRGVTRLVGGSLDALLGQVVNLVGPGDRPVSPEREAVLSALNGVLGDHLQATANPLAISLHLRHDGQPLVLERSALGQALPQASRRLLVLVHGLCMNSRQWRRNGHDHGAALAAEGGFTPLYLHYNTGLHISANGLQLADRLNEVLAAWPVPLEEIVLIGHSMGGLVARSAVHQAQARGDSWVARLTKMAFLGSPHHGAPLERGGHWVDVILGASPYTAAFARLGKLRSAGITDLRHGSLLEGEVAGTASAASASAAASAPSVPLPEGVACYALAGAIGGEAGALRERLLGDGLVPVASALGQHRLASRRLRFAPGNTWVGQDLNHLDLLSSAEVLEQLRAWLLPSAG
jgi:pimeloyl-ACP methyl ester carboxylesterase